MLCLNLYFLVNELILFPKLGTANVLSNEAKELEADGIQAILIDQVYLGRGPRPYVQCAQAVKWCCRSLLKVYHTLTSIRMHQNL